MDILFALENTSLFPFITAFCCREWDAGFVAQEKVLLEGNCFLISGEYQTSLRLMSTLPPFYSDEMMEQLNFFVFSCKGKWGILLPCIIDQACQGNVEDELWTKEVPCHLKRNKALGFGWSGCIRGCFFQWLCTNAAPTFFVVLLISLPFLPLNRPQAMELVSFLRWK